MALINIFKNWQKAKDYDKLEEINDKLCVELYDLKEGLKEVEDYANNLQLEPILGERFYVLVKRITEYKKTVDTLRREKTEIEIKAKNPNNVQSIRLQLDSLKDTFSKSVVTYNCYPDFMKALKVRIDYIRKMMDIKDDIATTEVIEDLIDGYESAKMELEKVQNKLQKRDKVTGRFVKK